MRLALFTVALVLFVVCMEGEAGAEGEKNPVKKKDGSEASHVYMSMDYDANGRVNITDVQGMMDWLFLGGTPAVCPASMDFDANGQVNVTDLMGLMDWLYLGGDGPFYPDAVVVKNCYGL